MLWVGIAISGILVVVLVIVLIFVSIGTTDNPTNRTRPENLAERNDLAELPKMYQENSGDAWAEYQAIFDFYRQNRANIDALLQELYSYEGDTPPEPPAEISEKAIDLFIAAQKAGTVTAEQLDSTVKLWPSATPDIGSPDSVALLAALRAFWLYYEAPGQKQRADEACRAIWCVGQTMYNKSNRIDIRTTGLEIIRAAARQMYNWSERGSQLGAEMDAWDVGLNKFEREYWIPKAEVVFGLKLDPRDRGATVGDLLNIALEDKELSWKLEATLALGRIKWNPRTGGNKKGILRAIDTLKESKIDIIKRAAEVADGFTKEDVRALN